MKIFKKLFKKDLYKDLTGFSRVETNREGDWFDEDLFIWFWGD